MPGALCLTAPLISSINVSWSLRADQSRNYRAGDGVPPIIPMICRGRLLCGGQHWQLGSRWGVKGGGLGGKGIIARCVSATGTYGSKWVTTVNGIGPAFKTAT